MSAEYSWRAAPSVIDDPRIERRHPPRAERGARQRHVDRVLGHAEVGVLVRTPERLLFLRIGLALEFRAVDDDAVGGELGARLARQLPGDIRSLASTLDQDQVVVEGQRAAIEAAAAHVDGDRAFVSTFAVELLCLSLDARLHRRASGKQHARETEPQCSFRHVVSLWRRSGPHCRTWPRY